MKLLYTVSTGYLNPQPNYINSLGGYVSSTQVPNDEYYAVFDELSINEIINRRKQYRAIILFNDTTELLSNVELYINTSETNICNYKLAAVQLSENELNEFSMESIPNSYSKPLNATFYEATQEDPASIGDIQPNQYIGLWLVREINYESAENEYNNVAEIDPTVAEGNWYKPIEKIKEEKFDLIINWN